jgi:hypothetical protein
MTANPVEPSKPKGAGELRSEIERTRAELADTLDAIEDRLNVVARARDGFGRAKHRFVRFTREDPILLGILGAAAVALVGGVTWAAVAASRR